MLGDLSDMTRTPLLPQMKLAPNYKSYGELDKFIYRMIYIRRNPFRRQKWGSITSER